MPRDKENQKKWRKEYLEKNKEHYKTVKAKWYEKNKDRLAEVQRLYRKNNPDKKKIILWKAVGMKDDDWPSVYEMFIKENECWICGINFNETTRHKCLDHDHNTGELRYVCCSRCNVWIIG